MLDLVTGHTHLWLIFHQYITYIYKSGKEKKNSRKANNTHPIPQYHAPVGTTCRVPFFISPSLIIKIVDKVIPVILCIPHYLVTLKIVISFIHASKLSIVLRKKQCQMLSLVVTTDLFIDLNSMNRQTIPIGG